MKSYTYHFMDADYQLGFFYNRYVSNGNLYIGLVNLESEDDPYFNDLTINITLLLPFAAIINDQLDPNICKWLESIGAGKAYEDKDRCNYGEYPLFQFDPEFLQDANPESFAKIQ